MGVGRRADQRVGYDTEGQLDIIHHLHLEALTVELLSNNLGHFLITRSLGFHFQLCTFKQPFFFHLLAPSTCLGKVSLRSAQAFRRACESANTLAHSRTGSPVISRFTAAYVDDQLLKSGKVARGAILGQQGGVWATSAGFAVSTNVFPLWSEVVRAAGLKGSLAVAVSPRATHAMDRGRRSPSRT